MASSVVSADSHVLEPADLWTTRLDNRFRDRAPRVVRKQDGPGYAFVSKTPSSFIGWVLTDRSRTSIRQPGATLRINCGSYRQRHRRHHTQFLPVCGRRTNA